MKNDKKRKLRAVALLLVLAAMLLPAVSLSAQVGARPGLFGRGDPRGSRSNGLTHDGFGSALGGALTHDGFGGGHYGSVTNDGFGSAFNGGITTDAFGGDTPLGGGLLVMTAAAACYGALRRRNPASRTRQTNKTLTNP